MKNYFLYFILALILFTNNAKAQECGSPLNKSLIQKQNPELYDRLMQIENHAIEFEKNSILKSETTINNIIRIPVVVHVLYKTSLQNISDDQIFSQIEVLNEDFRRLNADKSNTPSGFSSVASDTQIEFFLACIDPNGNPTNGITRTETDSMQFTRITNPDGWSTNEIATRIKFTSLHGHDAWPTNRYLNIWTCVLAGPLIGYAQFPGVGQTITDGVVVESNCFGKRGTLDPTYDKGRTATHEIGHWLNLIHIWGDDDNDDGICTSNECSGSDNITDTPNQGERNYGCPTYPKTDCCSTTSPGVMFMNFMDYTDDECKNLFTTGQATRMQALFSAGGFRECFVSSPVLNNWCQSIISYSGPSLVCYAGNTFTVNNLPAGSSLVWSCSSNLAKFSSSGNTAIFKALGNGTGYVQANVSYTSCGSVPLPRYNVTVGSPTPGTVSIDFDAPPGRFTAMIETMPFATSYIWYCDGVLNSSTTTTARFFRQEDCDHVYIVSCAAFNTCNEVSDFSYGSVSEPPCYSYSIFPNPASTEITITQNTSKTTSVQSIKKPIIEVRIIDKFGRQALTQSFGDEVYETKLNISNLQTGSYTIQINQGTDMETYTVIKE